MDCSIVSRESPDDLRFSGTEIALIETYRISVNAPSQMLKWFHFTGCMDGTLPMRSASPQSVGDAVMMVAESTDDQYKGDDAGIVLRKRDWRVLTGILLNVRQNQRRLDPYLKRRRQYHQESGPILCFFDFLGGGMHCVSSEPPRRHRVRSVNHIPLTPPSEGEGTHVLLSSLPILLNPCCRTSSRA